MKRTVTTRMSVSGDDFRRRCAKNILKNKTKRIRHKEHLLTVEETERMTEFLMKEENKHGNSGIRTNVNV